MVAFKSRNSLPRASAFTRTLWGRSLRTFHRRKPLAVIADVLAGSAKRPTTKPTPEFDPTVWLFVVSEDLSQASIKTAFRSETTINIKQPLHDRLRDVLLEIAIDVEDQLRPEPQVPVPNKGKSLRSLKSPLTPRQIQIAKMVSDGSSNKKIAKALGLSVGTVKVHLHRIFEALKISNRVQLATRAKNGALSEPALPNGVDHSINLGASRNTSHNKGRPTDRRVKAAGL
jgi:DNA-binding CsgD family transcriptional regulator